MESLASANTLLLFGATLVLLGIFSSLIATRFGAPILLIFLVIGMLAGEDGPGGVMFDDYRLTYIVGSLALAVILFDGGLRTKLGNLRGVIAPSVMLATVGVMITTGIVGGAAVWLLDLDLLPALLVGAIVASTDAAAVFFLIHAGGLELKRRVTGTLEMESGINDPMAVFLAIALVEAITAGGQLSAGGVVMRLVLEAAVGTAVGVLGGFAVSWVINRISLPGGLHPVMAVAASVMIFSLAVTLHGSGFLAAYLAGLVLGNRPLRAAASIVTVNDAATWLVQIIMFVVLGLLITPSKMILFMVPAIVIALVLMFIGRPVAVWICLAPFGFNNREKAFISWVGLRGAVSIFLAAIPVLSGVANAELFFNVAFFVVFTSLLLQGWTVIPAARWLDLALPRKGIAVQRLELDLPGQLKSEMVGYPVESDSAILMGGRIPDWAKPLMVVRDERIFTPDEAGAIKDGDYAYFLAPPERAALLDRMFASVADHGVIDPAYFGEFTFEGHLKLGELSSFYGIATPPEEADISIADLFARQFEDRPQVGDQLRFESAALVVQELDGDRVKRVGLHLDMSEQALETAGNAVMAGARAVLRALKFRK